MNNFSENTYNRLIELTSSEHLLKGSFDEFCREALCFLAENLQVSRLSFWTYHGNFLNCQTLYLLEKQLFTNKNGIEKSKFPVYFRAIDHQKLIRASEVCSEPALVEFSDFFTINDIRSTLQYRIEYQGKFYGMLCAEQTGKTKNWSQEDVFLLLSVASLIAQALTASVLARTEKKRLESVANYALIFGDSPIPMWIYDPATLQITKGNDLAASNYGYQKEELSGMSLLDLIPTEQNENPKEFQKHLQQLKYRAGFKCLHKRKDGSLFPVFIHSTETNYKHRRPKEIMMAFDLSEQQELERKTLESEKLFHTLFNSNPVGICIVDRVSLLIDKVNPAWERYTQKNSSELLGKGIWEAGILGAGSPEEIRKKFIRQANLEHFEVEALLNSNEKRSFLAALDRFKLSGKRYVLISISDITERLENSRLLAEKFTEIQNFRQALDDSAIITITDLKGNILQVNGAFCQISGYSAEEVIGKNQNIVNSGHHSVKFWKGVWKEIGTGRTWRGEIRNRAKSGEIYWVFTTINPMRNENGKITAYLSVRHDITKKKLLEEEQKALLKDLTDYTFLTSHTLRAPLARMLGLIFLLQNDESSITEIGEFIEMLKMTAEEIDEVITGMNDVLSKNSYQILKNQKENENITY